nr:reverse transcriptase [Tanacetum cinerariifolium]
MELEFVWEHQKSPICSFFADDNIFFTRSSVEESCRLKGIFTRYCKASGQVINYEKAEISFIAKVDIHMRTQIIECLNVREVVHQNKYLGLPSGRSKKVVFQAILNKIKKKLCGWKEKTLSIAGKEVWRLITSPTTLAARILKAHYFPRSSFFDAKIGYRPSYIWRSFLSVKDIVHKGCKWNIGNGRSC